MYWANRPWEITVTLKHLAKSNGLHIASRGKKKKKKAKASKDYFSSRLYKKHDSNLENIKVTYQFGKQCFQFGILEIAFLAGLSWGAAASMDTVFALSS